MTKALTLPPEQWPMPERETWQRAIAPARGIRRASVASSWSPERLRIVTQSLGQWFAWHQRRGLLRPCQGPADRLTEELVGMFTMELLERISSSSVAMMIGALKRGYDILAPDEGRSWLLRLVNELKSDARTSRNRFAHMVQPAKVLDLGIRLMEQARDAKGNGIHVSTQARDGLMLAMLICFPVRIGNFSAVSLGRHLTLQGDRYVVRFPAIETKTGRDAEGEYPPSLTEWIDKYLLVHRPRLRAYASGRTTSALWIAISGEPLGPSGVRTQIEIRTERAFGRHIWPHLFRAIAATGIVDAAPEEIAIASELLGHARVQTTEQHYILARGNLAHRAVQASILDARAAALDRLRRSSPE